MKIKEVVLSVCMITYGHEEFIAEAIISILEQKTDFEIELIVANDCSPDRTESVINSIIQTHPNGYKVRYTKHPQNLGVMRNFQWALGQCKGRYIAVCEGDDYWTDKQKLQKQVDFLERNPDQAFCYHYSKILDFDGSFKHRDRNNEARFIPADKVISTYIQLVTLVFRNQLKDFVDIDFGSLFSGDVALRAHLSMLGPGTLLPFEGAVYRKHVNGVRSGMGLVENYNRWIDSRIIILDKIHGISKRDLYESIINIQKLKITYFIKSMQLKAAIKSYVKLVNFQMKKYFP